MASRKIEVTILSHMKIMVSQKLSVLQQETNSDSTKTAEDTHGPIKFIPAARNLNVQAKWVLGLGSKDIYLQPLPIPKKKKKKK